MLQKVSNMSTNVKKKTLLEKKKDMFISVFAALQKTKFSDFI